MAATAIPAHADDAPVDLPPVTCHFSAAKVSPSGVVLGTSKEKTVKVTAAVTGCEAYSYALVEFGSEMITTLIEPSTTDPTRWSGTVELDPAYLFNDNAGRLKGTVSLDDGLISVNLGANLTLKRAVLLLDVATPSKHVKKSKSFWVGTHIERADWEEGYYNTYAHKLVRLQFRTAHGHFKTIKKVRSVGLKYEGSVVETKMKTKKSGCFRLYSDATSTTAAGHSKAICVKVK